MMSGYRGSERKVRGWRGANRKLGNIQKRLGRPRFLNRLRKNPKIWVALYISVFAHDEERSTKVPPERGQNSIPLIHRQ
jgi:hypothetical protein